MTYLVENESLLRFGVFAATLAAMLALEAAFPRRARAQARGRRWFTNLALIAVDTLALRLFLPILAAGTAVIAAERGWGLFNMVEWPPVAEFVLAILILDMLIYWQHVATHRIPLLWRLHKVHHADPDFDTTTGVRFHPVEIVLSMLYKVLIVIVLGPAVAAVILFEILLNACSLFNHANLRLPDRADRWLRRLIVTPDMHRVHHSAIRSETDSNYGFSLSLWDRLFRTYRAQPRGGHDGMDIGLREYPGTAPTGLFWSLAVPFRRGRDRP